MSAQQQLHILILLFVCNSLFGNNDSLLVKKYNNLALEARKDGDIELSIKYVQKARTHSKENRELLRVYNTLGASYYKLTDYHTALSYYDSAWTVTDSTIPLKYFGYLYNNFGLVYMQLMEFEKAIGFYKKASSTIEDRAIGLVYFNLAKCFGYLNDSIEEKRFYRLAYESNKEKYGIVNYYTILAGLELVEKGSNLLDELKPAIKTLDNPQLNGLYYSLIGDFEKAESYLNSNDDQLLRFYVKTKHWMKAVTMIDSLRNSFTSVDSKLFLQANEMLIYKNAIDETVKKDKRQAFRIAQKSYGNILKELSGYKLSDTKGSYNYFDFDSVVYLFINSSKEVEYYKIEADKKFWENYNSFMTQFSLDSAFDSDYYMNYVTYCKSGYYLYKKLLPKVSENMLIVSRGRIQYIPFECLPTRLPEEMDMPNYKTIPYLMLQSNIHYDYILREHNKHKGKKYIMALAPDSSLKYSQKEIEALKLFKSKRMQCMDAKLKYIFEGDVLHISTHYNPLKYSISFADSVLNIDEMKSLPREMVVLSMCRSGVGRYYYGEGVFSPGRAFYISGAKCIVESIWDASDQSSYFILWNFYKQLIWRKDKATALKNAKQKYLKIAAHQFTHPYYWANYRIIGNNYPIRLALHQSILPLVLISSLLSIIGLKYLLSRK